MRRRYYFSGYVQGVGFRWRAKQAAELYGVTGFVHNIIGGSVEMEVEGELEDIEKMVEAIGKGLYISISKVDYRDIPEVGDRYFEIR